MGKLNAVLTSPPKNSTSSRKLPSHCLKTTKEFSCFPKQFFFSIYFIRYVEHSFDRPTKHFLRNYRKIKRNVDKGCKNFSTHFFSKVSLGEVESSFKNSWIFPDSQTKIFRSIFKKHQILNFAGKKISPEVSFERESPVLTKTRRFSLENPGRVSVNVRKILEE